MVRRLAGEVFAEALIWDLPDRQIEWLCRIQLPLCILGKKTSETKWHFHDIIKDTGASFQNTVCHWGEQPSWDSLHQASLRKTSLCPVLSVLHSWKGNHCKLIKYTVTLKRPTLWSWNVHIINCTFSTLKMLPFSPVCLLIQSFIYINTDSQIFILEFGIHPSSTLFILLLKLFPVLATGLSFSLFLCHFDKPHKYKCALFWCSTSLNSVNAIALSSSCTFHVLKICVYTNLCI